jgi:soluble lytic murein transglycosylase
VRLEAWLASLKRSRAGADEWRLLLKADLPPELEGQATLELARVLDESGRVEEAAAVLDRAPQRVRDEADERLVVLGDGSWVDDAARRLAVHAPRRLRRAARQLEAPTVALLLPAERLERSASWRAAGWPRTAAAELRRVSFSGDLERLRRLELARAEVEAGATSRALGVLGSGAGADAEWQLARATAYRRQGWQRVPRSSARSAFRRCLVAAGKAASGEGPSDVTGEGALRLVLECGTETGRLDEAHDAWERLEASGWNGERREWLGRRLGVQLALDGRPRETVTRLASALPRHSRCLRFWSAVMEPIDRSELEDLADTAFSDLYGQWSEELLGQSEARQPQLADDVEADRPPHDVAWLLDRDALAEAAAEWRRIRARRGSWPAEGVAAAEFATARGRSHEAIGWLRAAVPELATVEMDRAPGNAVRAYLPLRWTAALRSAARESGLDPWLLAGVARQESMFVAHARSPRGDVGLLQLIPTTAAGHGRALGLGRRPDLLDPDVNLRVGARELRHLLDRFGEIEPALAAYNAGESRVKSWWRQWPDARRFTEAVPIPETYNYIRRVSYLAEAYRLVYREEWRTQP